ncbi:MAG TPA: hypothetical protein VME66_06295 [Candidatus Acidoferrales bacterium]|nr:hypothetical protein [Candidatus Acidoferrales bacterium]
MNRFVRYALPSLLILAVPTGTLAQHRQGASAGRPVSAPRPAPQIRQAAPNTGGFDFSHDISTRPPAPQPRPAVAPQRPVTPQQPAPPRSGARQTTPHTYRHAPNVAGTGPYSGHFQGPTITNPHHWNGSWSWNRGVVWQPAPIYWGGGFWGPLAVAALSGALFGSIVDDQDQVIYPSYPIEPDSPGAQLLDNYGLTQTPCGPENLVVIWGPDNSVICAYPNNVVSPGNYEVDPSTLTLVSQ